MQIERDRVTEIDLLRFVAAFSVVFFHYSFRGHAADGLSALSYPSIAGFAKYGYLGVDLFFMISGFVILMTASRGNLRHFVGSRIARLYPAYWVCCVMTFVAIVFFGAPRFQANGIQLLANASMVPELFGHSFLDGAYWSLIVELKFYFLVGLLLAARRIDLAELSLRIWLLVTVVLILVPRGDILRQALISEYAALFIAGATCYLAWAHGFTWQRMMVIAACWVLATLQSVERASPLAATYSTPMNDVVVSGVIAAFFVVFLMIASRSTGAMGRRSWAFVGALTYPLYLLHQNIGYILFNRLMGKVDLHLLFWGAICAVLALAYAVHVFVERPIAPRLRRFLEGGVSARKTG